MSDYRNHSIAMSGGNWIPPDWDETDEELPDLSKEFEGLADALDALADILQGRLAE